MRAIIQSTYFKMLRKQGIFFENEIFSPTENKLIDTFLSEFPTVDENFIKTFLTFQFSVYAEKDTMFEKGNVKLNWLIGQKAIDRWKRKKDGAYFVTKQKQQQYLFAMIDDLQARHLAFVSDSFWQHLDVTRFVGWPNRGFIQMCSGTTLGPGGHPLTTGHEIIANEIRKYIRN
jgi:hypothetical protein